MCEYVLSKLCYAKWVLGLTLLPWTQFSEWKFVTSSKVKFFQNSFVKKLEIIHKDNEKKMGGCEDALLIYGAPKFNTVYVVKWEFLGIQRAAENSVLVPSSQDLLDWTNEITLLNEYWIIHSLSI